MKRITPIVLLLALALAAAGCGAEKAVGLMPVAEHKASLAAVSAACTSIDDEHQQWAAAIAKRPDAKPLPDLSTATLAQRDAWFDARFQRHNELRRVLDSQPSQ